MSGPPPPPQQIPPGVRYTPLPHDPSNPNDPRNWNGFPTPTFEAPDPTGASASIVYSSFLLQPVPQQLIPPVQQRQQVSQQPPATGREQLEDIIENMVLGAPPPANFDTDSNIQALRRAYRQRNDLAQNAPVTTVQIYDELKLQNGNDRERESLDSLKVEIQHQVNRGGPLAESLVAHPIYEEILQLLKDQNLQQDDISPRDMLDYLEARHYELLHYGLRPPRQCRVPVPSGYQQNIQSNAGLPVGFPLDPEWPVQYKTHHVKKCQKFYVNDGPQQPGETDARYKQRVRRAVRNMDIERRFEPNVDKNLSQFANNPELLRVARKDLAAINQKKFTRHKRRINPGDEDYDPEYEAQWKADKLARQARNAVKRAKGQSVLRAELLQTTGMRLPTPPPPEDSGDELYDFGPYGPNYGPRRKRQYRVYKAVTDGVRQQGYDDEEPPKMRCIPCYDAHLSCNIASTGAPCSRCTQKGKSAQCVLRIGMVLKNFREREYGIPTNPIDLATGNRADSPVDLSEPSPEAPPEVNPRTSRSTGAQLTNRTRGRQRGQRRRRDNRSISPVRNLANDPTFVPCDNCRNNGRSNDCAEGEPPCWPCKAFKMEATCNLGQIRSQSQPYQSVPTMVEHDISGLGIAPPPPSSPAFDPLAGLDDILNNPNFQLPPADDFSNNPNIDRGLAPLNTIGTIHRDPNIDPTLFGINPIQSVPQYPSNNPAGSNNLRPFASQYGSNTGDQYVFENQWHRPADPQFEMEDQGGNWPSSEPAVQQAPGNSGYPSARHNMMILNTASGYIQENPNWNPDHGNDLFGDDNGGNFADFTMGGIDDEPFNPYLPQDATNLGQDPTMHPRFSDPDDSQTVLYNIMNDPNVLLNPQPPPAEDRTCMEPADYFTGLNVDDVPCEKHPTKCCDHIEHPWGFTCTSCHADQNIAHGPTQTKAIDKTKAFLCRPCSDNKLNILRTNNGSTDGTFKLGACLCTLQLRKTWLCHLHREEAITRVKLRTARNEARVATGQGRSGTEADPLVCPVCNVKEQDRTGFPQVWGCLACYDIVVEGGVGLLAVI